MQNGWNENAKRQVTTALTHRLYIILIIDQVILQHLVIVQKLNSHFTLQKYVAFKHALGKDSYTKMFLNSNFTKQLCFVSTYIHTSNEIICWLNSFYSLVLQMCANALCKMLQAEPLITRRTVSHELQCIVITQECQQTRWLWVGNTTQTSHTVKD